MKTACVLLCFIMLHGGCMKMSDVPDKTLEIVYADESYQLTGVAVSHTGRVFTNYPRWSDLYRYAVTEVFPNYQAAPYPDAATNSWKNGEPGGNKWVSVQSVYVDDKDYLWVVDPAAPKMEQVYQGSHKLARINLSNNTIERIYSFSGVADDQSYLNDVRVDTEKGYAYLTNSKQGGIVVVDLNSGAMRQVLQQHYSVKSDPGYTFTVDGKELKKNGQPVKIHSDGIALTPDGAYLYYKPLTDDKLYRIRTSFLQNASLTAAELVSHVEDLGHYTSTDGMIFDKAGNLYLGDIEHSRIVKITPDLKMTQVVQDDRLIWPDSYAVSNDGYLYISCSQIQKQPEYNDGVNKRSAPYIIYRIKLS